MASKITAYLGTGIIFLLSAANSTLHASDREAAPQPQVLPWKTLRTEMPELKAFFGAAETTPPEFTAKYLLRIASQLPPNKDKEQLQAHRKSLLLQAYWLGQQSPYAYPEQHAAAEHGLGIIGDRVYTSELDRLTIQAEAVKGLQTIDPALARRLLLQISFSDLPARHTCTASRIESVAPFYDTARILLKEEPSAETQVSLFNQFAGQATSELQVPGVLRLFVAVKAATPQQTDAMVEHLASMFDRIRSDDPAFSSSFTSVNADFALAQQKTTAGSTAAKIMRDSYVAYLVSHFSNSRCEQNLNSETFLVESEMLKRSGPALGLSEEDHVAREIIHESAATELAGTPEGGQYFTDGWTVTKDVLNNHHSFGGTAGGLTGKEKIEVRNFISEVTNGTVSTTNNNDDYRSRCTALARLAGLLPFDTEVKLEAYTSFVDLMVVSPVYKQDPKDWFFDVQTLLQGVDAFSPKDRAALHYRIKKSGNPVLALIAEYQLWMQMNQPAALQTAQDAGKQALQAVR